MKSRNIIKLMNKRGVTMLAAVAIALSTAGAVAPTVVYADEAVVEAPVESVKDFNDGAYFQNSVGYSIKSVNADSTAVKAFDYDLSKTLSDNSTICLKGNTLVKFDTKGAVVWEKELDPQVCYSTPTYNNLLVDSKDNIIVLGYYAGETNGIYAVYDASGNRVDYKYGTYVPVPQYEDSVTFDDNENLNYQTTGNTYYVYDRTTYNYTTGSLLETNYYNFYTGTKVVSTNDGGRVIIGYARSAGSGWSGSYYPLLIKVNSNNKVVYNAYETGISGTETAYQKGIYPKVYKTADGGLIVRSKVDGIYYKLDTATGGLTRINTYGTPWGFKSVNGVDYMYGKMGKTTLGDMASNIVTPSVDYVLPLGQDLTKGVYFNSNFGTIKDIATDADKNAEVLFSCRSNEIANVEEGSSKIISATLTK